MEQLPTSHFLLGIVWAQIGDNTWVKGGLFFHNALPLLQEEEKRIQMPRAWLVPKFWSISHISHTEVWQNSSVTFMTYWEINSPLSPILFPWNLQVVLSTTVNVDGHVLWLFPTTCLFTTTRSMDGEPEGWIRRKVELCFPEDWAWQTNDVLHKFFLVWIWNWCLW